MSWIYICLQFYYNKKITQINMRSKSTSKLQTQYISKLKIIDEHLLRNQGQVKINTVNIEDMMKMLAMKLLQNPAIEMIPFKAKEIFFQTLEARRLIYRDLTAPINKKYVLHIHSSTKVKISLKIDENKPVPYIFHGNKSIIIQQKHIKSMEIQVSVEKITIFSLIKIYLDLMNFETSDKKPQIHFKQAISKEITNFLAQNRGKSQEIMRTRSQIRMKETLSRRTGLSYRPKTNAQKNTENYTQKVQLLVFQKQKNFYIKHVKKMSPQKMKNYHFHENKYLSKKKKHMSTIGMIFMMHKFGGRLKAIMLQKSQKNLKKIKISLLCMDFIKIIKNKFRLKITQKARLRMTMYHSLQFAPVVLKMDAFKKARQTLYEGLMPYMFYRTIQEMGQNSQYFLQSVAKIQRYIKAKIENYRWRVQHHISYLQKKNFIKLSQKSKALICKRYLNLMRKQKRDYSSKIYTKKQILLEIMKQHVLEE